MPQPNHNTNQQWNTGNQQYSVQPQPRMMNSQAFFSQNYDQIMPHQMGNTQQQVSAQYQVQPQPFYWNS